MLRTVSSVSRILCCDRDQLKTWSYQFRDYLSQSANPTKGIVRQYTNDDVLALLVVATFANCGEPFEDICWRLDESYQFEEANRQQLYFHTPILQEIPDDLDESWRHGSIFTSSFFTTFELARNFKWSADELLEIAVKNDAALDLRSPVLFNYRHALELYLKLLGRVDEHTHSLKECLVKVERRFGQRLKEPFRGWIMELDKIDPLGTAFRYFEAEDNQGLGDESWIDYRHVKFAMQELCFRLDMSLLNDPRAPIGFGDMAA